MPFYNYPLGKAISRVIADCHAILGRRRDDRACSTRSRRSASSHSTLAGLSFGLTDLRVPEAKSKILDAAQKIVDKIERNFTNGVITPMERHNQLIDVWVHARERITLEMMKTLEADWRSPEA
jgi:DNA-directed RNA polymerase subunit beta'